MKSFFKNAKIRSVLLKVFILGILFSVLAFTTIAFAEIRYETPQEKRLKKILTKPNQQAVAAAKAFQVFTFKQGKSVLAGCLVCHSDKHLYKIDANGKKLSLYVNPEKFAKSVHGEVGCVGCHVGWGLQAHKSPMTDNWRATAKLACKNCHTYEFSLYSQSKHYKLVKEGKTVKAEREKGRIKPPTCFDCHGNHAIVKVGAKNSPVSPQNASTEVCGKCHKYRLETYLDNYMGKTRVFLKDDRTPACFECHGNHDVKNLENTKNAIKACRGCHKDASKAFVKGFVIHAEETSYKEFPVQSAVYWGMWLLIIGILGFLYPFTLLLAKRKYKDKKKKEKHYKQ